MKKKINRKFKKLDLKATELFAGVGGFRVGLESRGSWNIVWSNQWEPGSKSQFASNCYVAHFGSENHYCEDIAKVLDKAEEGKLKIPDHTLLVGGFPCQDYSVAKPLNQAHGIRGKKGVLWWEIYRMLELKRPPFALLENVDRLLKSPSKQRGRDFAVILSCLWNLGYCVEWRMINAADYGFPQRRRRIFILAQHVEAVSETWDPAERLTYGGVLARAFPVQPIQKGLFADLKEQIVHFPIDGDPYKVTKGFRRADEKSPFLNSGIMINGQVWTHNLIPDGSSVNSHAKTLRDVVKKTRAVDPKYLIPNEQLKKWKYAKGAKAEERTHKGSGFKYLYTEGALPFPDPLDRPSRTILTAEGGSSPSRFKHVIEVQPEGIYRRLVPEELEELNGFDRGWTDTGMSETRRAFCMGNALVVDIVERIGKAIVDEVTRFNRSLNYTVRKKPSVRQKI